MAESKLGKNIIDYWRVASLQLDSKNPIPITAALDPRSTTWEKGVAVFKFIDKHFPGLEALFEKEIFRPTALPLALEGRIWNRVAKGKEQIVFLVSEQTGKDKLVLKINIESASMPEADVFGIARNTKEEYETIKEWYKGLPIDIPEQHFLVFTLKNRLLDRSVFGVLEKYDESRRIDFFGIKSPEQFGNPRITESIRIFSNRFLEIYEKTGMFPDILGSGNVCLRQDIKTGEWYPNVMISDPHYIYNLDLLESFGNGDHTYALGKIEVLKRFASSS